MSNAKYPEVLRATRTAEQYLKRYLPDEALSQAYADQDRFADAGDFRAVDEIDGEIEQILSAISEALKEAPE